MGRFFSKPIYHHYNIRVSDEEFRKKGKKSSRQITLDYYDNCDVSWVLNWLPLLLLLLLFLLLIFFCLFRKLTIEKIITTDFTQLTNKTSCLVGLAWLWSVVQYNQPTTYHLSLSYRTTKHIHHLVMLNDLNLISCRVCHGLYEEHVAFFAFFPLLFLFSHWITLIVFHKLPPDSPRPPPPPLFVMFCWRKGEHTSLAVKNSCTCSLDHQMDTKQPVIEACFFLFHNLLL